MFKIFGTDAVRRLTRKKILLLAGAILVLLTAAVGASVAWLGAQSNVLSNTFKAAQVTCDVSETFSDGVKSNVSVCNTGTMDAYIRAALIPVWKDGSNVAGISASLADCSIVWGDSAWVLGSDGYYYCKTPVAAGASTPMLINRCTASPHGSLRFELQISAQAVQALPVSCVTDIWRSAVTGVSSDGVLEVAS